jgi:hypothetical protein
MDTVHARKTTSTPHLDALVAGEALNPAAPCYIKSSDGKIYMSNGSQANEAAEVLGFTPKSYRSGDPVTLFREGSVFYYNDGSLTGGDKFFIATTAGRLNDASTTGDTTGVAVALDPYHIMVTRASY